VLLVIAAAAEAMPAASLLGAPPLLLLSGRRVSGWLCLIDKRKLILNSVSVREIEGASSILKEEFSKKSA
jgi:hypothetical protein